MSVNTLRKAERRSVAVERGDVVCPSYIVIHLISCEYNASE